MFVLENSGVHDLGLNNLRSNNLEAKKKLGVTVTEDLIHSPIPGFSFRRGLRTLGVGT